MKPNKKQKASLEKEAVGTLTLHQLLAVEMGIPTNYLSALKRQKVVPQKVEENFTQEDHDVIVKMRTVYCDSELLRLQLQEFPLVDRQRLSIAADDFSYKKWERRVIKIYSASYEKLAVVKSSATLRSLWEKFRTPISVKNVEKTHIIRRLAIKLATETPDLRRSHRQGRESRSSVDPKRLQRWELRALHFYIELYKEAPEINTSDVLDYLLFRYNVHNTVAVKERVQHLRRIAAERVRVLRTARKATNQISPS